MSYGSMMGSGIYSEEVTREIVCKERCDECPENVTCTYYWNEDFHTDDWGNIDQTVTCPVCKHSYTYKEEKE